MQRLVVPQTRFRERVQRLQAEMEERNMSGVLIVNPTNILYLTGFIESVQPWERPVVTIVPRSGEPVMIANELSTHSLQMALERNTCLVRDIRFYTEHPRVTNRLPSVKEWVPFVASVLQEKRLKGNVGLDSESGLAQQAAKSAGLNVVSAADILTEMRLIKDEYELAIMKAAGEAADAAQEYFRSQIAPGKPIMEINFETARYLAVWLTEHHPASAWKPMVSGWTGADTICPHGPGGDSGRRVQAGDNIINIINYQFEGYWIENERTYIVGEPSEMQVRGFQAMFEAQQESFACYREGFRVADVEAASQAVFQRHGLDQYIFHRGSHGKGIATHEYPADTAYNYTPLRENMVLSCEPAIYIPGVGGFRHSDDVVVGKTKGEWLTHSPRTLEHMLIKI